ncbi:RNA polymerase sigma factor [Flavivirga sp. 57AJ16]|uniref:RNA polymerase sigma factor n=1 Tax=Flavivirga sp. 57AJ16 TaxID=3025307 RepID=UPI0023672996|nr:RNA polymerase sigma-70 factor [Flavivirga sp. 57AJ16]MDD7885249.1 RNA polymerase sigma-70 factor [Flavivirga sp. 57AJ16]
MKYTEKQLLKGLKKGNREVYKFIYITYYNELCIYIRNYTDSQSAEDIVQNILLKLWEDRNQTKIHTSLKSYLFKSVYYKFLDSIRKEKRINERLEALRYNTLNDIHEEDNQISEQRLIALRKAIDDLPPRCKEIFLLSKYDGLKYIEIAKALGISIYTVEGQIGKALKTIRKKLYDSKYINLFIGIFK